MSCKTSTPWLENTETEKSCTILGKVANKVSDGLKTVKGALANMPKAF
jgi:hypothetical protein